MVIVRRAPWRGFDYVLGHEVTLTRGEWRALIERASRTQRIGGDLTLFDERHKITHEVYDKEHR
jgi:hypothetical protein